MGEVYTVNLPDIGEGVVEGEVIEWLKKEQDPLQQDEPVVIVMTDKATVELPAPYPGKLVKQYFQPGEIAIKDKPLYDIELLDGSVPVREEKVVPEVEEKVSKKVEIKKPVTLPPRTGQKALATPPVRKLAKDLGVDINRINGSGSDGRVTKEDIIRHQSGSRIEVTPPVRLPDDEEQPIIGIKNLMAKKMAESKATAAHFSYYETVDVTRLIKLRNAFKENAVKEGIRITYMPFMIRALSLSLEKYPHFNSCVDMENNSLIIHKQHNIGVAMTTPLGLIVPVLKKVNEMSLQDICRNYEELKEKALNNKLSKSDMQESTFSISNFGVLEGGGLWASPVINYPEVGILAVARIQKQPVVKNNEIAIRDMLNLSWSFDHRIIDGDMAAAFSHYFAALLRNPAPLM